MTTINWPANDRPEATAVQVRNEIALDSPADRVWAWLVRAARWPDWYPNARDVRIDGGGRDLALDASFSWKTFGVNVRSTVREFMPYERIAWDGRGIALDVYHAWLIERRGAGCWVLTEETQNGLAARAQKLLMPNRMHNGHQMWLDRLASRAKTGLPPY